MKKFYKDGDDEDFSERAIYYNTNDWYEGICEYEYFYLYDLCYQPKSIFKDNGYTNKIAFLFTKFINEGWL